MHADVPADLAAAYRAAVLPLAYGTFDHTAPGAFLYDLAKRAKATAGAPGSRQRQKRLMRELKGMQAEDNMMVAPAASVFVRSDEERLDVVCPPPPPHPHDLPLHAVARIPLMCTSCVPQGTSDTSCRHAVARIHHTPMLIACRRVTPRSSYVHVAMLSQHAHLWAHILPHIPPCSCCPQTLHHRHVPVCSSIPSTRSSQLPARCVS